MLQSTQEFIGGERWGAIFPFLVGAASVVMILLDTLEIPFHPRTPSSRSQEGGYDLSKVGDAVAGLLNGFCDPAIG
jgi:hypothetical protein